MLNNLQTSAHGVVAKILLALLCLSFAVWGIDDMIRNPDRNKTMARVGGTAITSDQYMRALHNENENIRRLMGDNYSPEAVKNMNVEGYVLQNQINHRLLKLESVNLGLIPGDIDVVRRIRSNPSFQDSKGNFDKAIFESMLRNINTSEKAYVDQLREDMAINILLDTLSAGTPQSDLIAPTLLHSREEGRQITLYSLNESMVTTVGTPDDAAIKTYYDQHPHEFTAPELREFSFVTITADDVPKNPSADEEALKAAYNDRLEDYKRPERRAVEQLLYSSEAQAKKAYDIVKTGKSFADTASAVEPLNKGAISMGKVERHNIFDNAADTVFSLKAGETSEPVQSPFGWHIFHVSAIEPPSVAPFEEVRPALQKELQQRNNDEALNKLANQVEDALAGGSSLPEAAKEYKLKQITMGPVTMEGKDASGKAATLPALDKFMETVFKTEEKTESPIMTSKGGVFYIVRAENVTPEHLRPLDEVKAQVIKGWQHEERAHALAALAAKASDEFAGSTSTSAIVSKYKMDTLSKSVIKRSSHVAKDISMPPQLVTDAFSRKMNEGTRAYPASNGAYLLAVPDSVVAVSTPDKDPKLATSLAEINRNLQTTTQNEIIDEYTDYLRSKYAVKINEDVFRSVTN